MLVCLAHRLTADKREIKDSLKSSHLCILLEGKEYPLLRIWRNKMQHKVDPHYQYPLKYIRGQRKDTGSRDKCIRFEHPEKGESLTRIGKNRI